MSSQVAVRMNTLAWQAERRPVNSELRHYLLGIVENKPRTEAVAEAGTGATRFYCTEHQFVYPVKSACDPCRARTVGDLAGSSSAVDGDAVPVQEGGDGHA